MKLKLLFSSVVVATGLATSSAFASGVDADIPTYQTVDGVAGNVTSVGSDTLANLMTFWAEDFKKAYPNVNVQIQAAGSSTAPPALTEGSSNFGPMSRQMKDKEIAAFEEKYGYKPTQIAVAIDALAVFVNKDNPIEGLTIPQVDAIFSTTRECGLDYGITTWERAGVKGDLSDKAIQIFGRNSVSGTYGYFKKKALCKGDYRPTVNEQPGSSAVVQAVASGLDAIGYSGIGYATSGVRAVPLAKKEGDKFIEATPENALDGAYPLARQLYVYVNKKPGEPLGKLEGEFVKMMLSQQGQQIVVKDGYIPLPASLIKKQLESLGL